MRGLVPAAAIAVGLLLPGSAVAASWGSFESSRIAYSTGALTGDAHQDLRGAIEDNGDEVAAATTELTREYLAGVDVFYTAMLSDGTGPSAGAPGTLSLAEQGVLSDWIAAGGTLIVCPDSNGFDGPWTLVYNSYTSDYGIENYEFVAGPGVGSPLSVHPITDGVTSYSLDGTSRFDVPLEGEIIGTAIDAADPLLVVFEPASGFAVGGRILVLADHNAITDNFFGDLDNELLANNIVAWAGGECGNTIVEADEDCDDGNTEDGDGCSSTCLDPGGGSSDSSGGDPTDGDPDTTAGADSGEGGQSTGPVDPGGTTSGPGATGATMATGDDGAASGGSGGGGGCRTGGTPPSMAALLLLLLGVRRRTARSQSPRVVAARGPISVRTASRITASPAPARR